MNYELNEIKKMLKAIERRISNMEKSKSGPTIVPNIDQSLGEFLKLLHAKSIVETTLGIGYYLQIYKSFGSFNAKDIEKCFKDELLKKPKNINDMVNKKITKTLMTKSVEDEENQTAWKVTLTGIRYIDGKLKENE